MRILVVEDNRELTQFLAKALEHAGLDVDTARTAEEAGLAVQSMHYAAIVLDLGLPDADGLTLLDQLRRRHDRTPVLILSARGALDDRVSGLGKGASDYLVKPFAMDELVARVQVLLRRSPEPEAHIVTLGNVSLDTGSRLAIVNGKTLAVPAREAELLEVFLKRGERVVAHEVLNGLVFGGSHETASNAIEVYVHRLRKLLAEAGANVEVHTIRGVGYLMKNSKPPSPKLTGRESGHQ